MEFLYTEIMACLTGAEQNQIVKHFTYLNNMLGAILKLITLFRPKWAKPQCVYLLITLGWYCSPF